MSSGDAHWLWRLDAPAWLDAARVELERAHAQLDRRHTVVAHARRGTGMACNAVLVGWAPADVEHVWGRSYVDHLRAIADGALGPLPGAAQGLAARVLAVPALAPTLVALSGRRAADLVALLDDAEAFVELCRGAIATRSL